MPFKIRYSKTLTQIFIWVNFFEGKITVSIDYSRAFDQEIKVYATSPFKLRLVVPVAILM